MLKEETMKLKEFQNNMAESVFGETITESQKKEICISCKRDMKNFNYPTEADRKEFDISSLCPKCFDDITR